MQKIKIVVARNDDKVFSQYLSPSLQSLKADTNFDVQISEIFNIENDSIFKKYNRGMDDLGVDESDIYCFMHEDVKIHDKSFLNKLSMLFDYKKDIGVLGLIGTSSFPEMGGWWLCDHKFHKGHLIQGLPNGTTYHMDRGTGFNDELVSVDGFSFFCHGRFLKTYRFDENRYPNAYHFYDVDTCFEALRRGFKVAVADILLEHKSEGPMPDSWHNTRNIFINKWKDFHWTFPVTTANLIRI